MARRWRTLLSALRAGTVGRAKEEAQKEREKMVRKEGREGSRRADKEMLYGELWFSTSPSSVRDEQLQAVPSGSRLTVSMSCVNVIV